MKKLLLLPLCFCLQIGVDAQSGSVGIGTATPNSSAALDIQNNSKGLLIPFMTAAQHI